MDREPCDLTVGDQTRVAAHEVNQKGINAFKGRLKIEESAPTAALGILDNTWGSPGRGKFLTD